MSLRWMPNAVHTPAGAWLGPRRQLDGSILRKLFVIDIGIHVQHAA